MNRATWPPEGVSGREREILDIVYRGGAVTAVEVQEGLADPPVYGAVRTMLRRLEAKGHIRHRQDGPRYIYEPTVAARRARDLAFGWITRTFFAGSAFEAAAAALDHAATDMSDAELSELTRLVERMRERADDAEAHASTEKRRD